MIQEPVRYEELVQVVAKWSPTLKFNLIQDLLKSLEPTVIGTQPLRERAPTQTMEQAAGLLATDEPAPSDDEVDKILLESRLEKYG